MQRFLYAMPWEGNAFQSGSTDGLCFLQRPGHTHAEEAVGVLSLHLGEIGVLVAVDDFLHHNGSTHLGVIHIRKEHLGGILAVNHKGWQHLALLTEEF